jgi:eukaryotic-like serine/threonine-protein kinase
VEFKVENICGFLIRSKLMTPDEMLAMRQRWQAEAKEAATQVPAFLKWLVGKNYVTEYQAGMLSRGHVEDFYLGDYKILERIGRGRMAGVYKAAHPSGQVVAIKVLPPSRAKSGQTLARFQREARLAVKLKHPNVVRSFQVGETKGVHFLVMEYLEGETLDEMLARRKRLPPAEAVRLIHQALLGLQHIHEQGLVHRDLKPANLMLIPAPKGGPNETTLKSNTKILDIGLAREMFDDNAPEAADKNELTGEGVLLGTPDYLAPEQARDPRTIDIRADIYSLGCALYHLLTGQPPFPDKNILNQMIRHATETPKQLAEFNPSIPEGLQQIVSWMMAKQADQRYPTPARAAQALDAFLMVTAESSKPMEESPQLRQYLTWLEKNEQNPDAPAPKPASNQTSAATAPLKPKSSPAVPAAPALGVKDQAVVPKAASAKAERRPKKRTGVKIPGAAPANAVPPPTTAAAAPFVDDPGVAEQYDVELVEMPAAPPQPKGFRLSKRDILMVAIGGMVTTVFLALCAGVSYFVIGLIRGG